MPFTEAVRHASGFDTDVSENTPPNTPAQATKPKCFDSEPYIVIDTWPAKNGVDTNARVRSQDPTKKSFPVFKSRWIGEIQEGTIVLVQNRINLRWPAIVEVLGTMPMPISLAGMKEEIEWPCPEEQENYIKIRPTLETMMGQLLRILSQLD